MKLESLRVKNFRSINDSGDILISRVTALLGRNESGKSNLLRALCSLNPAEGFRALNPIKDFPRHRPLRECTDETEVVETKWSLNDNDRASLATIQPRAANVTHVNINRRYNGTSRFVDFVGLLPLLFEEADVKAKLRKIVPAAKAVADAVDAAKQTALAQAVNAFEQNTAALEDRGKWAQNILAAAAALRKAIAAADGELTDKQEQVLSDFESEAESFSKDAERQAKAEKWVLDNMPVFVFLDEYPELNGHQNIAEYLDRKNKNSLKTADLYFENLCKVADLDPVRLHQLFSQNDVETRNQLANRASALVTSEIRRLWKDRPLKIRFNLDANHLDTLISDPAAIYDVEVNLDERSRGFQWFFSFYTTFAADTKGGKAENAILLLDEPGLYLHARSQSDLLRHFDMDFENQIIYTTHSPFMVPTHSLDSVRTVNISEADGTTVTNDPTGDSKTLFPLQAALGYDLSQSLFVGPNNIVVEGVTDFWILSSVSAFLNDQGGASLDDRLTITPAGGAQKVSYMAALLTSESLNVLVLLDKEKESLATRDSLVKTKLISENNVVFVSEAFEASPAEADIEDLLDADVYENLVRESYKAELKGKELRLNANVPRIAKRVELAFAELGIEFHKTRPSRLFLTKMAVEPEKMLGPASQSRFETLFTLINERLNMHIARGSTPFR